MSHEEKSIFYRRAGLVPVERDRDWGISVGYLQLLFASTELHQVAADLFASKSCNISLQLLLYRGLKVFPRKTI